MFVVSPINAGKYVGQWLRLREQALTWGTLQEQKCRNMCCPPHLLHSGFPHMVPLRSSVRLKCGRCYWYIHDVALIPILTYRTSPASHLARDARSDPTGTIRVLLTRHLEVQPKKLTRRLAPLRLAAACPLVIYLPFSPLVFHTHAFEGAGP